MFWFFFQLYGAAWGRFFKIYIILSSERDLMRLNHSAYQQEVLFARSEECDGCLLLSDMRLRGINIIPHSLPFSARRSAPRQLLNEGKAEMRKGGSRGDRDMTSDLTFLV